MKKYISFFLIAVAIVLTVNLWSWRSKHINEVSPSKVANESSMKEIVGSRFIMDLRDREYRGGKIEIEETLTSQNGYTGYIFSYPSDGLKIYGRMNIPEGNGPFPVIILNHGYFNQSSFSPGDGTQTMADILVRNGYLTLAPDYRGFGKSENDVDGSRGHNPNYAIDVLNLLASVPNFQKADNKRIGMWGHSMGGEVSLRTVEATDKIKAVVLWAPTSTNPSENSSFYGRNRRVTPSSGRDDGAVSSENDLGFITAPISLHQGLSDTEVDPEWSKRLNEVLESEGKTVEYFEYPGQDHNFRNLGWDVVSKRTVDFFDKYLK